MRVIPLLLMVLAIFGAFFAIAAGTYEEQMQQAREYCEMVELYKSSGGENGWPDYNGNFEEVCDE